MKYDISKNKIKLHESLSLDVIGELKAIMDEEFLKKSKKVSYSKIHRKSILTKTLQKLETKTDASTKEQNKADDQSKLTKSMKVAHDIATTALTNAIIDVKDTSVESNTSEATEDTVKDVYKKYQQLNSPVNVYIPNGVSGEEYPLSLIHI